MWVTKGREGERISTQWETGPASGSELLLIPLCVTVQSSNAAHTSQMVHTDIDIHTQHIDVYKCGLTQSHRRKPRHILRHT